MAIDGSDERAVESSQLIASRLCIKNIPKYLNEARLKEHFGSKGEVTDVKILRTKWVALIETRLMHLHCQQLPCNRPSWHGAAYHSPQPAAGRFSRHTHPTSTFLPFSTVTHNSHPGQAPPFSSMLLYLCSCMLTLLVAGAGMAPAGRWPLWVTGAKTRPLQR
jgi:hypothetical protein